MNTPNIPPIIATVAPAKKRGLLFHMSLILAAISVYGFIAFLCYFQLPYLIWDIAFYPRPIPTDNELIQEFHEKRPAFEQLKTMVESDGCPTMADWGYPGELHKRTLTKERMKEYQRLLKSVKRGGVAMADGNREKKLVTITVYSWSIAVGKGGRKGFAYCHQPPSPKECLENLDYEKAPQRYARFFKPISENWYLYRDDP